MTTFLDDGNILYLDKLYLHFFTVSVLVVVVDDDRSFCDNHFRIPNNYNLFVVRVVDDYDTLQVVR